MKKGLTVLAIFAALTAAATAMDLGAGVAIEGASFDADTGVHKYGDSHLQLTALGVVAPSETLEIDPFVSYYTSKEKDPDGYSSSYDDKYLFTTISGGANIYAVWPLATSFRVLAGLGFSVGNGSIEYESKTGTYSSVTLTATVPFAAEVKVVPQVGIRAQGNLAFVSSNTTTYTYPSSKYTYSNLNYGVSNSSLGVGVFFYF